MLLSNVYAEDNVNKLGLEEYVDILDEHIENSQLGDVFNVKNISKDLMEGKGIQYNNIVGQLLNIFLKEIFIALKGAISIMIILVFISILKNLEIQEGSGVIQIADFVCFLSLSIIMITTFIQTVSAFRATCITVTTLMQVISPFLMAVLIATGGITTTGIIQPLLLFISSFIGYIITNLIVPFLSISVAFNIIHSLNSKVGLSKMSKIFSSSSIWIIGIVLTVFLGVLSLETSITSSVDSLAIKTTSAAVSNFIPVVGKLFSDSFETVVGATKIVSKVGGTLGILAIICVMFIPVIKIIAISVIYNILAALCEPICKDEKILKIISNFASIYKTMSGILIGIAIIFVISIGIILNIGSSIVK